MRSGATVRSRWRAPSGEQQRMIFERALAETTSTRLAGRWVRCWWTRTSRSPEPGGLRLGQDVVQAAGARKEVLAFVEVETAHASRPSAGCPGADGLPDLGDEERPEEPGRLVAEDTLGQPAQEDPTVEDLVGREAGGAPRLISQGRTWPSVGSSGVRPWGEVMAVPGEFWWPSVGTSRGRLWGVLRGR
jgi:hypothetical protein